MPKYNQEREKTNQQRGVESADVTQLRWRDKEMRAKVKRDEGEMGSVKVIARWVVDGTVVTQSMLVIH